MNRGAQTWDCGALGREEEEEGGVEGVEIKRRGGVRYTPTQRRRGQDSGHCLALIDLLLCFSSPRGSALDAALLTRRRQEVLGPGAPGVRASRWDGDGVLDLDSGDWDLSICSEVKSIEVGWDDHSKT